MEDIKEMIYCEPGDWASAQIRTPTTLPAWLDVNHPNFPKYFEITYFDKNGATVYALLRIPKHLQHNP